MKSPRKSKNLFVFCLLGSFILHLILGVYFQLSPKWNLPENELITVDIKSDFKRFIPSIEIPDSLKHKSQKESSFLSDKHRSVKKQTTARNLNNYTNGNSITSQTKQDKSSSSKSSNSQNPIFEYQTSSKKVFSNNYGSTAPISISLNPDVQLELGAVTALNTSPFKNYSFYNRVHPQIINRWQTNVINSINQVLADFKQKPYKSEFITEGEFILDQKGFLKKLELHLQSGSRELDTAAIDAINDAAPFLNPPENLIENDEVRMKFRFRVF